MEELCGVCGKPLDGIYDVTCMACGRKIHFPAVDTQGHSCACVVTQLYACALAFLCKNCAEEQPKRNSKS
jgi:hypothetical protein